MHFLLFSAAIVLILLGILGNLLPALPGTPLVFLGLWLAAAMEDYQHVGGLVLTLLAILTVIFFLADLAAAAAGAHRVDATASSVIGSAIGMTAGLFFGWPGITLGSFAGALIGEFRGREEKHGPGPAGRLIWVGYVVGTACKVALAFVMTGFFLQAYVHR